MIYSQAATGDDDSSAQSLLSNASIQDVPDRDRIFQLIDKLLSFEACLYHQVLPLALEENRVLLGMVNPEDTAAIEYVGRILSYMNYSLVAQSIAAEAHKAELSAYLKRNGDKAVKEIPSVAAKAPEEKTASVSPNDKPTFILVEREDLANLKKDRPKT